MVLPENIQKVLVKMYDKFGHMNHQGEEMRRKWTRMVAEQLVYTLGEGSGWGHKASSEGNPPSKDAIAQQQKEGKLYGWDIVSGSDLSLIKEGIFHDITGQFFIKVPPVNHLDSGSEPQPPTPVPQPPVECQCKEEIRRVGAAVDALAVRLSELQQSVAKLREPRAITGKVNARFLSGGSIEAVEAEVK